MSHSIMLYKEDSVLNNLQWLITKPNQAYKYKLFHIFILKFTTENSMFLKPLKKSFFPKYIKIY